MNTYKKLFKAIREHSSMSSAEIIDAFLHGADAGWPGFTYTADCVKFYDAYEEEIYELLRENAETYDFDNIENMISQFKRSDMLNTPEGRKNLLAWYALEEIGWWLEHLKENA